MKEGWNPADYAWDPESLVAVKSSEAPSKIEDSSVAKKAPKSGKRRGKNAIELYCQIEGCGTRLDSPYYKKYRVCPNHAKCPAVVIEGKTVRFCQKCARFHDLSEFDLDRRSCRVRLAEHNRRRREMMMERKPVEPSKRVSRTSDATTSDEAGRDPTAELTVTAAGASVYHTPCSSERSLSEQRSSPPVSFGHRSHDSTLQQQQHTVSVPLPRTMPNGLPIHVSIDDILAPLASSFHELEQIAPQTQSLPTHLLNMGGEANMSCSLPSNGSHQIPPRPPAALIDDLDADLFGDMDLDLALAGILDPVSDPILPPPPVYSSPDTVVRVSMKLFACMPSDLPANLRVELERTMELSPTMMEGYLRPGCTHLTLDMRLPAEVAQRLESANLEEVIAELAKHLPDQKGMLAQLGKQVALFKEGQALGSVEVSGAKAPRLAALSRVCVSVDEAPSTRVDLYGANIGRPGDMVLCRQHGRHVTVEMLDSPVWGMVIEEGEHEDGEEVPSDGEHDDASATGVLDLDYASSSVRSGASSIVGWEHGDRSTSMPETSVRLLGLKCGVAEVEVQAGGAMSISKPLLVLPDAAAAAEVESLACRARRAPWFDTFLRDAGLVVGHICSEGAAARAPGEVVEAIASRTAAYCTEAGCPRLARLLRRAQNALRRSMGTDDTASAMAEGKEGSMGKGAIKKGQEGPNNFAELRTVAMEQELCHIEGEYGHKGRGLDWRKAIGMTLGGLAMAFVARLIGAANGCQ